MLVVLAETRPPPVRVLYHLPHLARPCDGPPRPLGLRLVVAFLSDKPGELLPRDLVDGHVERLADCHLM